MKYLKRVLLSLLSICLFADCGYSQTADTRSHAVNIYTPFHKARQKSILSTKIVVLRYEKQTDTLKIPIVSDKYPALKKALSYKNLFDGEDLPEVINNYKSCGCGTTGLDYNVTFESESAGIISIMLHLSSMGAYSDFSNQWLTLNIHTGKPYPLTREINADGLKWLLTTYKITLKNRLLKGKEKIEKDNKDDMDNYNQCYSQLKTNMDNLKSDELFGAYIFTKNGLKLSSGRVLAHAFQALEPNRDWYIPYNKLKKYKTKRAIILNNE